MEGWHQLLYDGLRSDIPRFITALFFISWVFLGNFMLLNLFLAILLDSFTSETVHKGSQKDTVTDKERYLNHVKMLKGLEGARLIDYYVNESNDKTKGP
jgi:Ion transport protein